MRTIMRAGRRFLLPFCALAAVGCAGGAAAGPDVEGSQAYVVEGRALAERNLHAEAVDVFTKAVKANSDSPEAYFHRGCSYVRMRLGQEMQGDSRGAEDKALRDFDIAIKLNPAYGKAYFNRAMIFASRANYRAAAEDLGNACLYDARNPEPFLQLGRVYEDKFEGMGIAALERYDKYAELGGRDPATLEKVRAWREIKKQASPAPGAAPKAPSADDEKKAAALHEEFKKLLREDRKPEALKAMQSLLTQYGQTAYVRERTREFSAVINALEKK